MDWRHDIEDAQEFVDSLQSDIFQDYIYVYTPSGDIVELPKGSMDLRTGRTVGDYANWTTHPNNPTAKAAE